MNCKAANGYGVSGCVCTATCGTAMCPINGRRATTLTPNDAMNGGGLG